VARDDGSRYGWADVLRVDPVYDETPAAPAQAPQPCYEEQVPVRAAPEDDTGKRTAGGVIGAIVGGILGHQFGKGDGRKVATAGGAVAGAVVGSNVAANGERPDEPKYTIERRCPGTDNAARRIAAYDVEYRYRGDVYTSRLNYDPGDRIRVKVNVTPAD
jgi:uncharacterized protein YcfJ